MRHGQNWPDRLWLVRHGQSRQCCARRGARGGLSVIDLDFRDVDVPLSELGRQQAEASGRWFAALPENERPEVIISSPYIRARQTAEGDLQCRSSVGGPAKSIIDERLREREFGVFDGLTGKGIREYIPPRPSTAAASANSIIAHPAARAGPTSSSGFEACSTPSIFTMPAGACWSSATGGRCACAIFGGAGRGADPGDRQAGRYPELRDLRPGFRGRR